MAVTPGDSSDLFGLLNLHGKSYAIANRMLTEDACVQLGHSALLLKVVGVRGVK
jgi:hypothetical protein